MCFSVPLWMRCQTIARLAISHNVLVSDLITPHTLKFCLSRHFSPLLINNSWPPPPKGTPGKLWPYLWNRPLKERTIIPFHVSMHFQTLRMHYENIVNAFWKTDNAFQWPFQWNENSIESHFKTVAKQLEWVLRHWQHISTNPKTIENHFESNHWLEQFLMHYNCCFIALLFSMADSMENKNQKWRSKGLRMVNLSLSWSLVQSSLRVYLSFPWQIGQKCTALFQFNPCFGN